MTRINLLPEEERPLDSYSIRWEFAVIVVGLLLLVGVSSYGFIQNMAAQTLQLQYTGEVEQGLLLRSHYQEVAEMQEQNKFIEAKLNHYQTLTRQDQTSPRMEWLAKIMESTPANLWLESINFQADQIAITGYTFDTVAVSQFLRRLADTGFQTVVKNLNQTAAGNLINFSIEAERG